LIEYAKTQNSWFSLCCIICEALSIKHTTLMNYIAPCLHQLPPTDEKREGWSITIIYPACCSNLCITDHLVQISCYCMVCYVMWMWCGTGWAI